LKFPFYLLFVAGLIFVAACNRGDDPYTREIVRLANDAEKSLAGTKTLEDEVESLPGDSQNQTYNSSEIADHALALYEKYPDDPKEAHQINQMIAAGVPSDANPRMIMDARYRALKVRISRLLSLNRRLLKSADKFKWAQKKKEKIGRVALDRALRHVDSPTTHLGVMLDIVQVKVAVENRALNGSPQLVEKLSDLSVKGKKAGDKLTEEYFKRAPRIPFIDPNRFDKIWDYLPASWLRPWLDLITTETKEVEGLETELRPVFEDLKKLNEAQ
jgi:hypothetical protein